MVFPYLLFDGDCTEALDLYGRAFGAKNVNIRKYEEYAPDLSQKDFVMHAEMDLGDVGHISAADATWPYEKGMSVSIMVRASEDILRKAWAVLAEEGTVLSELAPFELEGGALLGNLRDKYGFIWFFT